MGGPGGGSGRVSLGSWQWGGSVLRECEGSLEVPEGWGSHRRRSGSTGQLRGSQRGEVPWGLEGVLGGGSQRAEESWQFGGGGGSQEFGQGFGGGPGSTRQLRGVSERCEVPQGLGQWVPAVWGWFAGYSLGRGDDLKAEAPLMVGAGLDSAEPQVIHHHCGRILGRGQQCQ